MFVGMNFTRNFVKISHNLHKIEHTAYEQQCIRAYILQWSSGGSLWVRIRMLTGPAAYNMAAQCCIKYFFLKYFEYNYKYSPVKVFKI